MEGDRRRFSPSKRSASRRNGIDRLLMSLSFNHSISYLSSSQIGGSRDPKEVFYDLLCVVRRGVGNCRGQVGPDPVGALSTIQNPTFNTNLHKKIKNHWVES